MPRTILERLNLSDTLSSAVELYSSTPNVEVIFENKINDSVEVDADRKQLIRAISNLIKNGIQSIPKGRMGKIQVVLYRENEKIHIDVSDNGKGIAEEEREKIFEPYFTTKSGGTGLGLALVKNIFNEFGADISFESQMDIGTTFTINFR